MSEEPLEEQVVEDEEEEEKRKEEEAKKRTEEDDEITNQAKLPETYLYIWGSDFIKPDCVG